MKNNEFNRYRYHGEDMIDTYTGEKVGIHKMEEVINDNMVNSYVDGASHLISLGLKVPLRLVRARNGESYDILKIKEESTNSQKFLRRM